MTLRLGAIIGGALLLAVLAWRVHAWREGYLQVDGLQSQVASLTKARKDDAKRYEQLQSGYEAAQAAKDAAMGALADVRAVKPKTLIQIKEVPADGPTCVSNTLNADFRSLWNASSAAYNVPAP